MALERTWLLNAARAEREAMGRTIQYTEPDRWDKPSRCDGWRNRDVIAHLAASDVVAAASVAGEGSEELDAFFKSLPDGQVPTIEAFNAAAVEHRAGEPFRSVVREWGRAADLFLARCSAMPAEEWESRRVYWVGGEMRVGYLLQSRVMEWWLHGEDVLAGAELPSRREHPPIYCVNDLAIRSIPYALSLAGLSFPGKSIQIELEATGGGSWHRGLAAKEVPAPESKPDAIIEGRGYQFALVAGRRLPAARCLEDGTLQVSGDVALANTILRHIRAFA